MSLENDETMTKTYFRIAPYNLVMAGWVVPYNSWRHEKTQMTKMTNNIDLQACSVHVHNMTYMTLLLYFINIIIIITFIVIIVIRVRNAPTPSHNPAPEWCENWKWQKYDKTDFPRKVLSFCHNDGWANQSPATV